MTIREYLIKAGECVVCNEPARQNDWLCKECRFHSELLDHILDVEINKDFLAR